MSIVTSLLFFTPVLYSYINDRDLIALYVKGVDADFSSTLISFLILLLCVCTVALMQLIGNVKGASYFKFNNSKLTLVLSFSYLFIGTWAFYKIASSVGLFDLFVYGYSQHSVGSIGALIPELGLLGYLFLMSLLMTGLFLLLDTDFPKFFKFIIIILVGLLLVLTTRREYAAILIIALCVKNRSNNKFLLFSASIFCMLVFGGALVRVQTLNGGLFESFITSEEFYPFQFGTYLVLSDYVENKPLYITPLRYFFDINPNISWDLRMRLFFHFGPGPTISIIGVTYVYGIYISLLMLGVLSYFTCRLYHSVRKTSSYFISYVYSFFLFKLFLVFRNGEFPIIIFDEFLFCITLVPVFFVGRLRIESTKF